MDPENEGRPLSQSDIEALGYQSAVPEGVPPDSPPEEGVRQDAPRPGEPAPEKLADGTDADKSVPYDRFRQVNDKAQMYENLWGSMGLPEPTSPEFLQWASGQGQQQQPSPQPAQAQPIPEAEDEAEAWMGGIIEKKLGPHLAPLSEIKEFVEAQKVQANKTEAQRQVAALKQAHPEFNEVTDLPALARALRNGAPNLEAAYRMEFWTRRDSPPPAASAPTGDIRGTPATAGPNSSLDELYAQMMACEDPHDREMAASRYVAALAEKNGMTSAVGL